MILAICWSLFITCQLLGTCYLLPVICHLFLATCYSFLFAIQIFLNLAISCKTIASFRSCSATRSCYNYCRRNSKCEVFFKHPVVWRDSKWFNDVIQFKRSQKNVKNSLTLSHPVFNLVKLTQLCTNYVLIFIEGLCLVL